MTRYVIVGNGMAGVTAARDIYSLDSDASITIITDEHSPFYSRPGLMYHMMGDLKEWDLAIARDGVYKKMERRVNYASAIKIRESENAVDLNDGESVAFDRLLLATGSKSTRLDVGGSDLDGIHFMYSLRDCKRIAAASRAGMNAVVIGGGLLGAELAEVWHRLGLHVTVLVREPWYFPKALSEPQGRVVEVAFRRHGCELLLGEEVAQFKGEGSISGVVTRSGKQFSADLVGVTIGVKPNIDLARASGLETARGILVDPTLRTSREHILSAGDCAEIKVPGSDRTRIEQLWYSAQGQGRAAARSMCGDTTPYDPGLFYNSAMFFDVDYVSVGSGRHPNDGQDDETVVSRNGRAARRFVHRSGVVTGITTVGASDNPRVIMDLVASGTGLDGAKRRMGGRGW